MGIVIRNTLNHFLKKFKASRYYNNETHTNTFLWQLCLKQWQCKITLTLQKSAVKESVIKSLFNEAWYKPTKKLLA